jgi:hypothetical protein
VSHFLRLQEIMRRREELSAQCDLQRAALSTAVVRLGGAIKVIDRVTEAAHFLGRHPLVVFTGVTLIVAIRRRGLWNWAQRGLTMWRAYRSIRKSRFFA